MDNWNKWNLPMNQECRSCISWCLSLVWKTFGQCPRGCDQVAKGWAKRNRKLLDILVRSKKPTCTCFCSLYNNYWLVRRESLDEGAMECLKGWKLNNPTRWIGLCWHPEPGTDDEHRAFSCGCHDLWCQISLVANVSYLSNFLEGCISRAGTTCLYNQI